jgi:A1 cistron-splicing factor AAR2
MSNTRKTREKENVVLFVGVDSLNWSLGIDLYEWELRANSKATPINVRGIRSIPHNRPHYIHYSLFEGRPGDTTGDTNNSVGGGAAAIGVKFSESNRAPRVGFFECFGKEGGVRVFRYSKRDEEFIEEDEVEDEEEIGRYAEGFYKGDFEHVMVRYPESILTEWDQLTSHVKRTTIDRLQPTSKRIKSKTSSSSSSSNEDNVETSEISPPPSEASSSSSSSSESSSVVPRFTEIDSKSWRKNVSNDAVDPGEVTKMHLDTSFMLQTILERHFQQGMLIEQLQQQQRQQRQLTNGTSSYIDKFGILGELQFAFVCFLTGHSYEGFEQWKKLLSLFCGAEEVTMSWPALMVEFVQVLKLQLSHVPNDFFIDPLSGRDLFLKSYLRSLIELCSDSPDADLKLKMVTLELKSFVIDKFGIQLSSVFCGNDGSIHFEDDDDAPVLVEL